MRMQIATAGMFTFNSRGVGTGGCSFNQQTHRCLPGGSGDFRTTFCSSPCISMVPGTPCPLLSLHWRRESADGVEAAAAAQVDVFAFGLVVLELVTAKRMDYGHNTSWPSLLDSVKDQVRGCSMVGACVRRVSSVVPPPSGCRPAVIGVGASQATASVLCIPPAAIGMSNAAFIMCEASNWRRCCRSIGTGWSRFHPLPHLHLLTGIALRVKQGHATSASACSSKLCCSPSVSFSRSCSQLANLRCEQSALSSVLALTYGR